MDEMLDTLILAGVRLALRYPLLPLGMRHSHMLSLFPCAPPRRTPRSRGGLGYMQV